METVTLHEAQKNLAQLVEKAAKGKPFIISKSGRPMVQVSAVQGPHQSQARRLGFMEGQISVPADFDSMGSDCIATLFS